MRYLSPALVALSCVLVAGCGGKEEQQVVLDATAEESTVDLPGGPALVLTPADPSGRLVIYTHGAGEDQDSVKVDPLKAPMVAALLEDGYTVAAANADGNAWGSSASVEDYVALHGEVDPQDGTYLLSQSMGGLAGMQLLDELDDVRAMAAIYPVCDLASMADGEFGDKIEEAYGDDLATAQEALSPALPEQARGLDVAIWASPDDTVVPAESNGYACADGLEQAGANVTLTETTGDHGDESNFDTDAVVALFADAS